GTPLSARQAGRSWNIGVHLASHRSCVALSGAIGDAVLVRISGAWGENRGAHVQETVWRIRPSTPNYPGNRKVPGAQWIRGIGILVELPSHWRKHSINPSPGPRKEIREPGLVESKRRMCDAGIPITFGDLSGECRRVADSPGDRRIDHRDQVAGYNRISGGLRESQA